MVGLSSLVKILPMANASTDEGLNLNCNDLIFDYLIGGYYKRQKYFDFGISNEKNGLYLNKGLPHYKSQFGAHAVVQDFINWKFEPNHRWLL